MRNDEVMGGLDVAKVSYSCLKTRFSQFEKIYEKKKSPKGCNSHQQLYKSRSRGANGCEFLDLGCFRQKSNFR